MEVHRASSAAVGSLSRRRVNKSGRGAISQPPASFICSGLMSLALKAYSAQASGSETLQLSFVSLYAFMLAEKSERGNTITASVKVCTLALVCVRMALVRVPEEAKGLSLNNFPLCASIATDLYGHRSQLRQARLKLLTRCAGRLHYSHERGARRTQPSAVFGRCRASKGQTQPWYCKKKKKKMLDPVD